LANRLSSQLPSDSYDGIALIIGDRSVEAVAGRFCTRTREALACAATRAPQSYARLRKDIRSIVLWRDASRSPYHPIQLAALVPVQTALESDILAYAAWLLYTSGLSHSERQASDRTDEFLRSLDPDQHRLVSDWLFASGGIRR